MDDRPWTKDKSLNHLDIEGREHFEQALAAFEGTVIAVAHDRTFLRHVAARVFDGGYAVYLDEVHR